MASIIREENGPKTIQFVAPDGRGRPKIRLGKVSMRLAQALKVKVESLLASRINGHAPDEETSRWLASRDQRMLKRLAEVGLIDRREAMTLAPYLDSYIAGRTDVKPRTRAKYVSTQRNLVAFFGGDRNLKDITPGDADEWRIHMLGRKKTPAENTIRKHTAVAKVFFNAAVRKKLIEANPFEDLKSTVRPNPDRFYFVTAMEAQAVLDACPDREWRLIFALSRYGGLRCPSEHLELRWGDVNWERGRMLVRSPKTEHHRGGESRVVPLFPELRVHLEECFDAAEPGQEFVISRTRDQDVNLRKRMTKIVKDAGLKPWPKLFQNLRSSRQTELEETWPSHVVCSCIGNSEAVAARHYLQVTDDHFAKAVQNPVQSVADSPSTHSKSGNTKPLVLQGKTGHCDSMRSPKIAEAGLEPARPIRDFRF